ncbi:putative receptor-like protein kinase At4g00960 isoform X1 [Camellia sinensis]|uniref:putative receptor-like protein kinase At4g00960 isoform X1 n=1 Tax=Camellia sinensis TaxID=4442 RepID=UPI0010357A61|nr:putative receptor-like protein kinase At4g00960 isoform X1 [Camellia sinensis]XP_028081971.1 putative receptor-like protein kinase At4g00960 isoform X1 [Camellia sinensis]
MPKSSKLRNFFKPTKSKKDAQEIVAEQGPKEFSFKTLSSATESFHAKNKLGKGGFAQVYKGKLNDGREIAVKRPLQISDKGKELVLNELKLLLGSAHHRNIVKFLGFCSHREEMLLVFEFASNGSLDYLLFNSETGRADVLEWKRTYDIIVGVARALLYLHERSHSVIIHCDIKPANILIDENWVPKIADFGTASLLPQDQTQVNISEAAGTLGYSAPEYKCSGHVSPKADIYGFGVVVLELISGQKNWLSHDRSSSGQGLRDRANELYKEGRVSDFMDRKLIPSVVRDQVELCIQIGIMCTEYDPELRPSMGHVYSMLSENHGSSSNVVEEPVRDGSSLSTTRNLGPIEVANNGSSSGANIHLENEGLPKHRRLTRARRIQPEDVQSYIPSIPSSSCSSTDGPTELANNGSSSGADIHLENEGLPKHRRLTRARRIQLEDVQSYIPSIPSSSSSSIDGPTELANNGSSFGADIHLENEGLPKYRRLTHSRRIQSEEVQSYISSIQIEPVVATPEEEEEEEEDSSPTCSYDQANKGSNEEGSQTATDGGGG